MVFDFFHTADIENRQSIEIKCTDEILFENQNED